MKTKNKILGLLAGIACVTLGAGVGASVMASANTDMTIDGKSAASFRMDYGASVRFNKEDSTDDKIGIRFSATLNKNEYTELEKLEGDVNYGMIIVPQDIAATNPLTKENLFGSAATYCLETPKSVDEENGCVCTKQHVASVEYPTLATVKGKDTVMQLRGSLVDIKAGNLNREFVGLGYIEYGDEYVLAQPAYAENTTENPDVKNNTRSMAHVAQLAIEDGQDDENNTLYDAYLKGFIDSNTQFKYTVNHHLPNDEDGYDVYEETLYASLGEEVSATHVKEGNVKDVDGSAYRLYEIGTLGNPSGKVYASGRTVLNAYYAPIDTTLDIIKENNPGFFLIGSNDGWSSGTADLDGDGVYTPLTANEATYLTSTADETVDNEKKLTGDDERTGVAKIVTDNATNYLAGSFKLSMGGKGWEKALANDFAYIKLHMYIDCDNSLETLSFRNWESIVASDVETHKWVDVIVPLAKLNYTNGNRSRFNSERVNVGGKNQTVPITQEKFLANAKNILGFDSAGTEFLNTWDINTAKTALTTTAVTYYIDEVSWGIDTKAPDIAVTGFGDMFEGTFTEPTITVTDDMCSKAVLDSTVETKLYKVEGETRTEVPLVDGTAELTKGTYVYVVTADDRIYSDVVGNVATEEFTFNVLEKTNTVVVGFGADDIDYVKKATDFTYDFEANYVDATTLTNEVATIEASDLATGSFKDGTGTEHPCTSATETITPTGGALKVVAGQDTDKNYGCRVGFNLYDKLALIKDATSVTIRMYLAPDDMPLWTSSTGEVDWYGSIGNKKVVSFNRFTWVDVTIETSTLGTNWINYFNGSAQFWTNSNTMDSKTGHITYYFNSITFNLA